MLTNRYIDDELIAGVSAGLYQFVNDYMGFIEDVEKAPWSRLIIQGYTIVPILEPVSVKSGGIIANLTIYHLPKLRPGE